MRETARSIEAWLGEVAARKDEAARRCRKTDEARQKEAEAHREAEEARQKAEDARCRAEEARHAVKAMEDQVAEAIREMEQLEEKAKDALHELGHGTEPAVWLSAKGVAAEKARLATARTGYTLPCAARPAPERVRSSMLCAG